MSITGQVGHVTIAKQTAAGTPNTTAADHRAVKITGDSLVANNNMLVAEGEIGTGRDVSQAVPGGFSAAGAVNGNLRVRSAAVFLEAALGTKAVVPADGGGTPPTVAVDQHVPANDLPHLTVEKKIGTTDPELLVLRYADAMVNTLNISVPSAGLATFSAGIVAAGEEKDTAMTLDPPTYAAASDDLLLFHGGRVRNAETGTVLTEDHNDSTFQSIEFVINNNVATDEYTVRPSRFLRSLTEGIRSIEANLTLIFEDDEKYEQYTYGAAGNTSPGYSLYNGAIELFLGNWQVRSAAGGPAGFPEGANDEGADTATPTAGPAVNPQAIEIVVPKLAFAGLPVALASGRIAVTTTARALKPASGNIISAITRPSAAGLPTPT
jgi:hypothetical protein